MENPCRRFLICQHRCLLYNLLSVPLVAQRINLVSKFCQILICTAFVVLNNCHQTLSCGNQAVKDTLIPLINTSSFPLLAVALSQPLACNQIITGSRIWRFRVKSMLCTQTLRKFIAHAVFPCTTNTFFGFFSNWDTQRIKPSLSA